ncbi:MAG: acyl-CoA/acyl-ACP dehydrogenase [Chloroflexi bacterium]|nr:acyl-CoA/acyl-ACP dehydrogenase [Chloroflexota bacterium]
MDLGFTESQQMLRSSAREFLERECPTSLVRAMEQDDRGYTPDLWREMAELGWLGLAIPEQYGGMGLSYLDLALLLEETGRALLPGPFFSTVVLGAMTLLEAGSQEQKQDLLPKIAQGQLIATLALTEPSATYTPSGVHTTARATGDHYVLNGTKLFVPDAQVADVLIVAARTRSAPDPAQGVTLFLVDARSPGVRIVPLKTIAGDKQAEVQLQDAAVLASSVVGRSDQGWAAVSRVLDMAAVGKCAEMLGGADRVLEMTVGYVKERVQFGRPVGSFQAVQHHCANMATDVEGCRYVTYQAAWRVSERLPAATEVAIAKAWVSDAYQRVCALAHQCHGAIGFTSEYDLQLFTRRGKTAQVAYGDSDHHRELVAQGLGL